MADSKKYNGSTWEHSLRKLTTATDTFTTLPVDIYADGNNATVGLKGNTVQSGTPNPDNPIMPNGTGDMTENLFDYSAVTTGYRIIWTTGELYADSTGIMSDFIEVSEGKTYKVSDTVIEAFTAYIIGYNSNKEYLGVYHPTDGFRKAASSRYSSINIPTGYDCKYIKLMTFTSYDLGNTSMFTEGSSLPSTFIPYGYKIPISSGGKNLFDLSTATNEFINSNGSITPASAGDPYYLSDYISADNVTISVEYKETAAAEIFTVGVYDSSKSFIRRDVISNNSVSYENVAYIRINYRDKNCQNAMVNRGSTPLPYEPYNRTTTPVYLGEVETTRKIMKLVLTGEETWSRSNTTQVLYTRINNGLMLTNVILSCCSHYPTEKSVSSLSDVSTGYSTIRTSGYFVIKDINYSTYAAFQAYLAEQYANGTPVTVWYVLAIEETGIVNEPLMRIGDYADEVSNISIPTITGKDTFDVETTLKPSEASISYTGWHNASVKEFDGSQWNE